MAQIVENPKGFKVVQVNIIEVLRFGGLGICDACNDYAGIFFYVPVLNHCYCQKCYDEWTARAKYYPEDKWFEDEKFEWIKNAVNIENYEK